MLIFYYQFRFGCDSRFSILDSFLWFEKLFQVSSLSSPITPLSLPPAIVICCKVYFRFNALHNICLDCKVFPGFPIHASPTLSPPIRSVLFVKLRREELGGIMLWVLPEICARDNASKSLTRALAWAICRVARKGQQRAGKNKVINMPIDMPIDNWREESI